MNEYDQTFDPKVLSIGHCYLKFIGHCDLISQFSDFFSYISALSWYVNIVLSHCVCI